ncbi:MAG: hypothetical protein DA328_09780 [Nitrososphaeraceae archaeon]|nr:hypothetical protein [Nitrososphaeraceae archaeon]
MIYRCEDKHVCFSKDDLKFCAMKECTYPTTVISNVDIDWFYKINKNGLCIRYHDINKIIEDPNMPLTVKKQISKIFFKV